MIALQGAPWALNRLKAISVVHRSQTIARKSNLLLPYVFLRVITAFCNQIKTQLPLFIDSPRMIASIFCAKRVLQKKKRKRRDFFFSSSFLCFLFTDVRAEIMG